MASTTQPKYLSGDKQAIEEFLDKFDVCLHSGGEAQNVELMTK